MVTYALNCGQYVKHRDGQPIQRPLDEVAIAVSVDEATSLVTLHKHGDPEGVAAWFERTKAKLAATGTMGQLMAEEMKLIQGRFELAQLNAAINGSATALHNLVFPPLVIDVDCVVLRG